MAIAESERRLRSLRSPSESVLAWSSRAGLISSFLMLALAPIVVADSYSVVENTLSESGGQGVDGAWVLRTGVVLAAGSVLIMTTISNWGTTARISGRVYALALISLAVFPESPWDGGAHDRTVAYLHTVSGVIGAASFIIGVLAISLSRPSHRRGARAFDWLVATSVALIPQVMLLTGSDGLLQRLMVALGYVWLFAEALRLPTQPGQKRNPDDAVRIDLRWGGDRPRPD